MGIVRKTPQAETSLDSIGEYIVRESQNLETGLQFLDQLDAKMREYSEFPHMGEARPDLGKDCRCFHVNDYVIIYRPAPNGIIVLYVCHGARDVPSIFRQAFQANN